MSDMPRRWKNAPWANHSNRSMCRAAWRIFWRMQRVTLREIGKAYADSFMFGTGFLKTPAANGDPCERVDPMDVILIDGKPQGSTSIAFEQHFFSDMKFGKSLLESLLGDVTKMQKRCEDAIGVVGRYLGKP